MLRFEPFHRRVLDAALQVCDRYGLCLMGGYSIQAHGLVERASKDLDFAASCDMPLEEVRSGVTDAFKSAGLDVTWLESSSWMARLMVTDPSGPDFCEVDLLKETLQKPPVKIEEIPVVHLDDAIGLKIRALHERSVTRDYIDAAAAGRFLRFRELERLARPHTERFSPRTLVENLEVVEGLPLRDFEEYGLDEEQIREVYRFALAWADEIKQWRFADGDADEDYEPDIEEALYED